MYKGDRDIWTVLTGGIGLKAGVGTGRQVVDKLRQIKERELKK